MTAFVRGPVGWVEVICGPMFSGKSEELIRRLRRAQIARQRVQVFKPVIDDRYGQDEIVSHSAQRITASNVRTAREILEGVDPRTQVVGMCAQALRPAAAEHHQVGWGSEPLQLQAPPKGRRRAVRVQEGLHGVSVRRLSGRGCCRRTSVARP